MKAFMVFNAANADHRNKRTQEDADADGDDDGGCLYASSQCQIKHGANSLTNFFLSKMFTRLNESGSRS